MIMKTKKAKPVAVFQRKDNNGKLTGLKIYYYNSNSPDWWCCVFGKPINKVPDYSVFAKGVYWISKQYVKTVKDLIFYHKKLNEVKIKA